MENKQEKIFCLGKKLQHIYVFSINKVLRLIIFSNAQDNPNGKNRVVQTRDAPVSSSLVAET
jgi:hypothetical protein